MASRLAAAITTVNLESLGDSITSAVVVAWSKQPGDAVKEDDVITVVETDKVTMDIRAKSSGTFVEGLVAEKGEVTVGSPLYKMDSALAPSASASTPVASASAPAAPKAPKASPAAGAPKQVTVSVPIMGESITTGILAKMSTPGTVVRLDEVIGMIETDKVTVEVRAPGNGTLVKVFAEEGTEVEVGKPLYVLEEGTAAAAPAAVTRAPAAATKAPAAAAAPVAAAAAPKAAAKPSAPAAAPAAASAPVTAAAVGARTETRVKMTRMRQRIAARLKESQNTAAMLTTFQEVSLFSVLLSAAV